MSSIHFKWFILVLLFQGGRFDDRTSLGCDFKENLCSWESPGSDGWTLGDYQRTSFGQPVKLIPNGGFVYVNSTRTGSYSLTSSSWSGNTEPFCLYFHYYMFGPSTGSLTLQLLYTSETGSDFVEIEDTLWKRSGSQYDDWILGKYHFNYPDPGRDYRFLFTATTGNIALGPILVKTGPCEYSNECDFEDPTLCLWSSEPDYLTNYRWIITNGMNSGSDLVGYDATTRAPTGHYMRSPKTGSMGAHSVLKTVKHLTSKQAKCLSFSMYKSGPRSDLLQVSVISSSTQNLWYSTLTNVYQQWIKIYVDIPLAKNLDYEPESEYFQLALTITRGEVNSNSIAIDDVSISPDPCNLPGSCDFNSGLCDYRKTSAEGEILVGFGRLPDNSVIGWDPIKNIDPYDLFAYTNTPRDNDQSITYSLESPIMASKQPLCLSFSYVLTYASEGGVSVKRVPVNSTATTEIWSLNPGSKREWRRIEEPYKLNDYYDDTPFRLTFTFSGTRLFAALDDISITLCDEERPEKKECSSTGFVDEDCVEIVPSMCNNWAFMNTSRLPERISSLFDAGGDRVLAFDSSFPSPVESISYFFISHLRPDTPHCLKFWYLVDGDLEMKIWNDQLKDELDAFDEFITRKPIATFNNHFGVTWDQAKIHLTDVTTENGIVFGASYKANSRGAVIIAGLELIQGACLKTYEYYCNFEQECIWTNLNGSKLIISGSGVVYQGTGKWSVFKAIGRLPSRDASLGTSQGYYASLTNRTEKAIFMFPPIYLTADSTELCFTFAVYPVSKGTIDIIVEQNGIVTLVEGINIDSLSYKWLTYESLIKVNPSETRVVRVYLVGMGLLAIDDLRIKHDSCSDSKFICNNGTVISQSKICDFIKDCPDGEDESKCGDCEFNEDFCAYEHDDLGDWSIQDGLASVEARSFTFLGSKTFSLLSPVLQPTAPSCKLQLKYPTKSSSNRLQVLVTFQDQSEAKVWDDSILTQIENDLVEVNLGRIPIPFNLLFYAKVTSNFWQGKSSLRLGSVRMIDCGFGDTTKATEADKVFQCLSGKRIRTDQVCDLSSDCIDGDDEFECDLTAFYTFENSGLPNFWVNYLTAGPRWTLVRSTDSVPSRDHTKGLANSNYMGVYPYDYLYSTFETSFTSQLIGPELTTPKGCSIVFYYNLAGVDLKVSLINDSQTIDLQTIEADSVFGFKRGLITLEENSIRGPFNFLFTALHSASKATGDYVNSYYAVIDDIVIDPVCWAETKSQAQCPDGFYCPKDGTCISSEKTCDYVSDCSDGADERYCGPCNFKDNLCGWTNEGEDKWVRPQDFKGTIERAEIPSIGAPKNYIIPDGRLRDIQSVLRSPRLGATSESCGFKFLYFAKNEATITVRVVKEGDPVHKIVHELTSSEKTWVEQVIYLPELQSGHYIRFVLDNSSPKDENDVSLGGLAGFQFIDCNPNIEPTTMPATIPTTISTTVQTTTTHKTVKPTEPATTKAITTMVPTFGPTTEPSTKAPITRPATSPGGSDEPPSVVTEPSAEPTTKPEPYTAEQNKGVGLGSVSIACLAVLTLVLSSIVAMVVVRRRTNGCQARRNPSPLIDMSYLTDDIGLQDLENNLD